MGRKKRLKRRYIGHRRENRTGTNKGTRVSHHDDKGQKGDTGKDMDIQPSSQSCSKRPKEQKVRYQPFQMNDDTGPYCDQKC
ncbi:hypothetical protein AA3271_2541 [Gluconobacter japonicus NBRC 3271]|nr:hypothetical protein AA3271_2541 [Gluconobacter japonicus NBRC 3271]